MWALPARASCCIFPMRGGACCLTRCSYNAPSCFLQEIPKRLIREEQSSAAQSASYGYGAPAARGAGWGSYGGSGMRRQGGYQDNESRPQYGYGDTMPQRRAPAPKAPARPAQQPWNIPGVQRGFVASPRAQRAGAAVQGRR